MDELLPDVPAPSLVSALVEVGLALAECGAPFTGDLVAAVGVVFTETARRYVPGTDEAVLGVVDRVLYLSDFPDAVWEMPLAGLYTLLYEWDCEHCRPRDEIRVLVREACAEQLTGVA